MTLTLLTDQDIQDLLEGLTSQEVELLGRTLLSALEQPSTSNPPDSAAQYCQPERTIVQSPATGATTLFMPSYNPSGYGVKGEAPHTSSTRRLGQPQLTSD